MNYPLPLVLAKIGSLFLFHKPTLSSYVIDLIAHLMGKSIEFQVFARPDEATKVVKRMAYTRLQKNCLLSCLCRSILVNDYL